MGGAVERPYAVGCPGRSELACASRVSADRSACVKVRVHGDSGARTRRNSGGGPRARAARALETRAAPFERLIAQGF